MKMYTPNWKGIECVEVERMTEHFCIVKGRRHRRSDYFATFEECKADMIIRQKTTVGQTKEDLAYHEKRLAEIEALKEAP